MSSVLAFNIDSLKKGKVEKIHEILPFSILEIEEEGLQFCDPIAIDANLYATSTHIVLYMDVESFARMPCSICNEWVRFPLVKKNFYHLEAFADFPSLSFDLLPFLREALFLELPLVIECNNGHCPEREKILPYLKKSPKSEDASLEKEESYFPFRNL